MTANDQPHVPANEPEEQEIHLRDYLRVLGLHRWTIIAVFILITVGVTLYSLTATPIYQSSTTLIIEPKVPKALSMEDVLMSDISSQEYYQSQYEIIKSRPVAKRVINKLDLRQSEEFFPQEGDKGMLASWKESLTDTVNGWKESVMTLLHGEQAPHQQANATQSTMQNLQERFRERLSVDPVRNSQLVHVRFQAQDPQLAAKITDAVAKSYIRFDLDNKIESAEETTHWLAQRLDEAQSRVEAAERELQKFKEEQGIVTSFSGESEKLTAQTLSELNKQLSEAKARRVEAEARYEQARAQGSDPAKLDTIPELLKNPTIASIRQQEVEISAELAELAETYGSRHPKVVSLKAKLSNLRSKKRSEIQKVINSLQSEYEVALARERSLRQSLEEIKNEAQQLNRKSVEYGVLKRKAESARNMYETLLKRFKETSLSTNVKTGNIRVVESATIPDNPIKPNKKRNVLLAMVLGLMLGVGLAFFLEYLDNTVKTPDDIKRFKLPFLAAVPLVQFDSKQQHPELVAEHAPQSAASESYRSLRTNILFSSAEHEPQAILVSSAGPEEGKSMTCANLGLTMAHHGSKTIMLDCYLRRPRLHHAFDLQRETGMSNALTGSSEIKDLIQPTGIENLEIIAAGPVPPNPSELLGSKRMGHLLQALRQHYDRIIIDSPPMNAVTDASVLSRLVDGVVLVLRSERTVYKQLETALQTLRQMGAPVFGAVLNGIDIAKDKYYYYYNYYYTYYTEDDGSNSKRKRRSKRS